MIDRWAWLAHGPQLCLFFFTTFTTFSHFLPYLDCSVAVLYYILFVLGLLSIKIGSIRTNLGPT